MRFEQEKNDFSIIAARNIKQEKINDLSSFSSGVLQQVIAKKEPFLYHDVQSDPKISQFESIQIQKIKSIIGVPIFYQDMIWGVILADSQINRKEFTEENLLFLKFFSNLVSLALNRITHIESLSDRVKHLEILREIQKKTHGFTEFVLLPFVKENPILSQLENFRINPSYGMDDLKLFCVARIFLNNFIDNIQCSWVKLGPKFAQVSLNYGVNDFSGTLMEENISKSAGAEFGEYLSPEEIIKIIKAAGKKPAQRDTLYNILRYY